MHVRCTLDKHTGGITLVVESPWRTPVLTLARSVGDYFTEAGAFSEGALQRDVVAHVAPAVKAAAGKKTQ